MRGGGGGGGYGRGGTLTIHVQRRLGTVGLQMDGAFGQSVGGAYEGTIGAC